MAYTVYFLIGIPFWLISFASILRDKHAPFSARNSWAAMALCAPVVIFGLGATGTLLAQQRLEADSAFVQGFGYVVAMLNTLAFFAAFAVQLMFRSRFPKNSPRWAVKADAS